MSSQLSCPCNADYLPALQQRLNHRFQGIDDTTNDRCQSRHGLQRGQQPFPTMDQGHGDLEGKAAETVNPPGRRGQNDFIRACRIYDGDKTLSPSFLPEMSH